MTDINTWFHHLAGENLFEKKDERFIEYRKKWQDNPKNYEMGSFPLFVDIETTNFCNLRCPFCTTTISGKKYKKGFIDKKIVEKIIKEGSDNGLYGVKFNIRGEPLLHKEIIYFVELAKKENFVDVYFNTNALLLDEIMSKKLIDSGLDRISISFEGSSKEIYEKNRVGSNYYKVLKNIEYLKYLKESMGVSHPKIRIQTVSIPEINIENYIQFWKDKVDEVAILDYKNMTERKKGFVSSWSCPQLWQRLAILWDGTILPCNHDDDFLMNLGNILDISIKEAWNSNSLNNIRDKHKNGLSHLINSCDGCFLRQSQIEKEQI